MQTPKEGPDVCMHIHRKVVAYLLVMYPQFAEYVQADGSIITLLLKAMYGCVQASKLKSASKNIGNQRVCGF